jgi:hypothetical protein
MKNVTKVVFASALVLSVVAPTVSQAAYFVDQTKTWATNSRAQAVDERDARHWEGLAQAPVRREGVFEFYGTDNTSVPGASVTKDDTVPR